MVYFDKCFTNSLLCLQIGTGFKDEDLEKHHSFLKDHVIEKPKNYYRFNHGMEPDHWFDTVQVWEVKAADLSISPIHTAASGLVSLILVSEKVQQGFYKILKSL